MDSGGHGKWVQGDGCVDSSGGIPDFVLPSNKPETAPGVDGFLAPLSRVLWLSSVDQLDLFDPNMGR